MPILTKAPTPQQFAKSWTKGFARAVREAAGRDGRLSENEGRQIADRGDALERYADNVSGWFKATGQKSVSVDKLIAHGHNYAKANGERVAGSNQRMSLLEARALPADLRTDFFELRGHVDPIASRGQLERSLRAAVDSGAGLYFTDRAEPTIRDATAFSPAEVETAVAGEAPADEVVVARGASGPAAADAAVSGMRAFADQALGDAARVEAHAAIDELRDTAATWAEDAQLFHVERTHAGETTYSDVLALGLSSGRLLLVDLPE
jgi:hypothetical protein